MRKAKQQREDAKAFDAMVKRKVDWKRECLKAQDAYMAAAKENDAAQLRIRNLEAVVALYARQRDDARATAARADEELTRARARADDALAEQRKISKGVDEDFMKMAGARVHDRELIRELEREVKTLQVSRETKEGLLQLAETKLGEARAEIVSLETEIGEARAEIESLKRQLTKQLEREAKAVAELEDEIDDIYLPTITRLTGEATAMAERDIERSLEFVDT